jgi:vancomycin aglycone glucosyltransferase
MLREVRVVLAGEGSRGDIHPLLDLGERLRAEGHAVVLCAPPDFAAEAERRGVELRPTGVEMRAALTERAPALVRGGWAVLRAAHSWALEVLERQLDALPVALADCDFVLGAGMQLGGASAAELRGLPYRYVVFCPVLLPSAAHAPFMCGASSLPGWANRLAWRATRAFYDRLLGATLTRRRAALGLGPVRDVLAHLLGPRPLLAADAELAPLPAEWRGRATQLECLHAMDPTPLPPKLESFLDSGPPPVYLGFGSMTDPDPDATTRLLVGAARDVGRRALISRGWAGLGGGALPEGALAIDAVSHARLFPRVAAVVHHGGAGTTTLAARCGAVQLVVPHGADQPWWGERVRALGLGPPPLPRRRLTRARLAQALAATLDNEVAAERAREVGERLCARLGDWRASDLLI